MTTRTKIVCLLVAGIGLVSLAFILIAMRIAEQTLATTVWENNRNLLSVVSMNLRERRIGLDAMNALFDSQAEMRLETVQKMLKSLAQNDNAAALLEAIHFDDDLSLWMMDRGLNLLFRRGSFQGNLVMVEDSENWKAANSLRALAEQGEETPFRLTIPPHAEFHDGLDGFAFYLPAADVIVCLLQDRSYRENAHRKNRERFIQRMRENTAKATIGASGYLFIADSGGGIIAKGRWDMPPRLDAVQPTSGRTLWEDIREYAGHSDKIEHALTAVLDTANGQSDARIVAEYIPQFDWYAVCVAFRDELTAPLRKRVWLLFGAMAAATLVLLGITLWFAGRITAPLAELAALARRTAEVDFLTEPDPARMERLHALRSNPMGGEVEGLAEAFLFMDDALRRRVRELLETAGVRERMEGELNSAREIQAGILPGALLDQRGRFAIDACLEPAREVGGDLYDHFMVDDDRVCLVMGDVSGKGVPAALFMAMTLVLVRMSAHEGKCPAALLREVNAGLAASNPGGMFVTLFAAYADVRDGTLEYACAGHNPPVIRSVSGVRELVVDNGMVAGFFPDSEYVTEKTVLSPGDTLVLYTDGVTEAMDVEQRCWGTAAMHQALVRAAPCDPEALNTAIREGVRAHVGECEQSDDLAILCFTYHG